VIAISETVKRKRVLFLVSVVCLITAVSAVYMFDVLTKQAAEKTFSASFALMPNQEGLADETWRIYVSKDATNVLRNVDIFTSYGNQTIFAKHFDELTDQYHPFDVRQVSGEDMTVDIYWQGGHQNFFCRNQDAATE